MLGPFEERRIHMERLLFKLTMAHSETKILALQIERLGGQGLDEVPIV